MKKQIIIFLLFLSYFTAFAQPNKREMRGAWVATVANIDWPTKAAIGNSDMQQAELLAILDSAAALHLNMIVFQIRPTADALYQSEIEPWSHWLTGKQGQENDKPYDPLAFFIAEAHKRFIDVHVWLNPYRVTNGEEISELAENHLIHQHPEWFVKYGTKHYFNPGLDETRAHLARVVADIVRRYDIDAIHFDDYFYPYKIKGQEFPDAATFAQHPRGFDNIADWRRNNVNLVIKELHDTIKAIRPWVEFGISPFGVWRNASTDPQRGSKTQAGVQNYDDLYADILLWLKKGWIDYVAPQLYWEIGKKVADYAVLAEWWQAYSYGRNLYIGQALYCIANSKAQAWYQPNEICRQIALNRKLNAAAPNSIDGTIFYPFHSLVENRLGLCDSLRCNYFRYPALTPINRNIVASENVPQCVQNVLIHRSETEVSLTWNPWQGIGGDSVSFYIVYAFPNAETPDFSNPAYIYSRTQDTLVDLTIDPDDHWLYVTAMNRYKQESTPAKAQLFVETPRPMPAVEEAKLTPTIPHVATQPQDKKPTVHTTIPAKGKNNAKAHKPAKKKSHR